MWTTGLLLLRLSIGLLMIHHGQEKLADPQQFGEVITNDVKVAQAARELELQMPPPKRKGLRRVKNL